MTFRGYSKGRRPPGLFPALAAVLLLSSGCSGTSTQGKSAGDPDVVLADPYGTTYEIFVGSFADSNGDGIGDLNGILENLDYLNDGDPATREDLGVNALWLTPVFPSPTYHKYDATDYYAIDPAFGTLADYDALVSACHERGVRLYLDLAVNHTSVEHPWFTEAAAYLGTLPSGQDPDPAACPYVDYYVFSREQQTGYEPLGGTEWYYEARFWSGMPDLNLDSEAVRNELRNILGFWLDRGADGFRLDAMTSYYTDDHARSEEFLTWIAETVHQKKPGSYLVGEAWENQDAYAVFYKSGIDSLFDFAFAGQEGVIAQAVRSGKNGRRYVDRMIEEEELYASMSGRYINAPFYTNHDMARSYGYYAKDTQNRVKLAMALNLLQTGNAFVYYGEELGMRGSGKDENKRAPFPWKDAAVQGAEGEADAGAAEGTAGGADGGYLCAGPADMESFDYKPCGTLEEQKKDEQSVYNFCREMIHLRARHPLIARGRTVLPSETVIAAAELERCPQIALFIRQDSADPSKQLLIAVNTGAEQQEIGLLQDQGHAWSLSESLTTGTDHAELDKGGTLRLPGYAIAVLE